MNTVMLQKKHIKTKVSCVPRYAFTSILYIVCKQMQDTVMTPNFEEQTTVSHPSYVHHNTKIKKTITFYNLKPVS